MEVIRDCEGTVIRRSRNLSGIRRYVSNSGLLIRKLALDLVGSDEGKLMIIFEDGSNYVSRFACFDVLKLFVRRWRNVRGAPLWVNGVMSGIVEPNNSNLK